MNPPAFQFYADDFLAGTLHFTDAEVGLYMRLLCVQWSSGGLVDDDAELQSYGKGGTPIARVKSKFKKGEDGLLRNERMEVERKKQEAYRLSRSGNGKHGGRPCKAYENHMVLKKKAQKSSPSPSPSPSPEGTNTGHTHTAGGDGEHFPEAPSWEAVQLAAAKMGLPDWRAKLWYDDMEKVGWIDKYHRRVRKWQSDLATIRTYWEVDGRPSGPTSRQTVNGKKPESKQIQEEIPLKRL